MSLCRRFSWTYGHLCDLALLSTLSYVCFQDKKLDVSMSLADFKLGLEWVELLENIQVWHLYTFLSHTLFSSLCSCLQHFWRCTFVPWNRWGTFIKSRENSLPGKVEVPEYHCVSGILTLDYHFKILISNAMFANYTLMLNYAFFCCSQQHMEKFLY